MNVVSSFLQSLPMRLERPKASLFLNCKTFYSEIQSCSCVVVVSEFFGGGAVIRIHYIRKSARWGLGPERDFDKKKFALRQVMIH